MEILKNNYEISYENEITPTNNLFIPLNLIMLRTPILSSNFYKKIFNVDNQSTIIKEEIPKNLFDISRDGVIREAIGVASMSLLDSIKKWDKIEDKKKREQVLSSFMKYFIRMSTRTTPFGLFSGVAIVDISDKTDVVINNTKMHKKRTRPDMEWILAVVKKLESNYEVFEQLNVRINPLMSIWGNRAELSYASNYGQAPVAKESVSIRATGVVKYVYEILKDSLGFKDLFNSIREKYPDTRVDKIKSFLCTLIDKEFIITELRPPLMTTSPLDYVIEKLSGIKGIQNEREDIKNIRHLIDMYDNTEIGMGEELYLEIISNMKKIANTKNLLQVDMSLSLQKCEINYEVVEEISKAAECLWRLSTNETNLEHLEQYRMEFMEKYGIYREIPVLEILNPDIGLGAPALYEYPKSKRNIKSASIHKEQQVKKIFMREMLKAIKNGEKEIIITSDILEKIEETKLDFKYVPISMELNVIISANTSKDVDEGRYTAYIGPNIGSPGAGKTFGRFIDIIGDEARQKIYDINNIEKQYVGENVVFAEIVYLPAAGKVANVVLSENIRDYEIVLSTNSSKDREKTLQLSDLVVGVTNERLYLKSKSLGKEVVVTTGHMLNILGTPNIYRFLREISMDGKRDWSQMGWKGYLEQFPYVPRVKYGKVVISPAQWKLSLESINYNNTNFDEFKLLLRDWCIEWNVPRFVYYAYADNRILLDMENELHINEIYSILNKKMSGENILLVEPEANFTDNWVKGIDGSYFSEFVMPFVLSPRYIDRSQSFFIKENNKNKCLISTIDDRRFMLPGGEWAFFKIYGNSEREDEFIAFVLKDFCFEVIKEGICQKFFYIRYVDTEPHIRLRFKGNKQKICTELLPKIYQWFNEIKNYGFVSKICIDTYEREIERYGGPGCIDLAEDIFYHDSIFVTELLYLNKINKLSESIEIYTVASIIYLLEGLEWTFEEQLRWLDTIVLHNEYRLDYRNYRDKLRKVGNSGNDWDNLKKLENGEKLIELLKNRGESIKKFIDNYHGMIKNNELWNTEYDVIESIIHIHCNRLFGTNREKERKIIALTRHTLKDLKYFKENNL